MTVDAGVLVARARVLLDRDREDRALSLTDIDTLTLDAALESQAAPAARLCVTTAPVELLDGGLPLDGGSLRWRDLGGGYMASLVLPPGFLRLVWVSLTGWERPVTEVSPASGAVYALQRSRRPGLRGTCQRPVAVVARTPLGLELELYTARDTSAELTGTWWPEPVVDRRGGIMIPSLLREAVAHTMCALWLETTGDGDAARAHYETAKSMMA